MRWYRGSRKPVRRYKLLWRSRLVVSIFVLLQFGSLLALLPAGKAFAAAPTLSSYQSSNWGDVSTGSEVTGTLTWSSGDLIVAMGVTENGQETMGTPTATGLTFSLVTSVNNGDFNDTLIYVWSATAGSGGSSAVTSTGDGSSNSRGLAAYAYSGSAGIGNTNTMDGQDAKTISLTRAYSNSAVIVAMGDWIAGNDNTVTASPSGGTVRKSDVVSGQVTSFLVDWADEGGTGTTSYGVADFSPSPVDMSGIVVEVRGNPASLEQEGFRFRADDGDEDGATWLASQDTDISRAADTNTRLRMLLNGTDDPGSAQYQLEWRKVSGPTDWRKVSNTPQTGQQSKFVTTGSDDAQQVGTTMTLTGTTIGSSLDATTDWAGMRFPSVNIPKGATITSAFISIVPSAGTEDEPLVTVYAENADNSGTFTTTASDISNRSRTTGVSWSSTDLGASGTSYHNSPDLSSDIQTVIDRSGWSVGNPVTILVQGGSTGTRDLTIEAFENTGNNPPQLTINYTYPDPAFELAASSNITASGENTTVQLTAPSGKSTSDFDAGRMQDDENPADAVDITTDDYTEMEWSIKAIGTVVSNGETYEFRVTNNGTALTTYTVTPEWTIASNTAPDDPTSLAQKKTDDSTISTGGWTNETSVKFTASAIDDDTSNQDLQLCVEYKDTGTSFNGSESCGSAVTESGTAVTVTVTISSIPNADQYHWRARVKDQASAASGWVVFDTSDINTADFGVDTTAPTGGTVYDGTSAGVDSDFNNGTLNTLSANWSGFSDSGGSGISKYQYSIGTTPGGTTVKNWTDNADTDVTDSALTLESSKLYYINVRAVDAAGNNQASPTSADGQMVLPQLSFSISSPTVTFSRLNAANNWRDTETTTLTTSTNAFNGYVIRAYALDFLRFGSYTIGNFSGGSYASPAAWPNDGSLFGFGFSTNDADIFPQSGSCPGGGTAPCFAPFTQTAPGDIVANHTGTVSGTPVTDEAFTITYKTEVQASQAAAPYQTVIIYTNTATY